MNIYGQEQKRTPKKVPPQWQLRDEWGGQGWPPHGLENRITKIRLTIMNSHEWVTLFIFCHVIVTILREWWPWQVSQDRPMVMPKVFTISPWWSWITWFWLGTGSVGQDAVPDCVCIWVLSRVMYITWIVADILWSRVHVYIQSY